MRSIVRRDTGESYDEFLTRLAKESGIETPTRAQLARMDRKRAKKGSNEEWTHPHDPDARITKMKDGRTHLAHKAEHVHAVAIVLSLTRCLWIAAFVVFGFHLLWWRSKGVWVLPLVAAAAILLAPGPLRYRITETFRPDYYSNAERVQMWRVGWQMIREQPIFGMGPGRIEPLYTGYLSPSEPIPAYHGHLHNNAIQLGAQFGVLVLSAALIFVMVLIWDLASAPSA